MKGVQQLLSFSTLITVILAGGSIDNSDEAKLIRSSASTLSGNGNYVFENVATGQQLSFRRDSITNFFPSLSDGDSLEVQERSCLLLYPDPLRWVQKPYASQTVPFHVPRSLIGRDVRQLRAGTPPARDSAVDAFQPEVHKATTTSSETTFDSAQKAVSSKANATTTAFLSHTKGVYEYPASSIPRKLIDQPACAALVTVAAGLTIRSSPTLSRQAASTAFPNRPISPARIEGGSWYP